MNSLSHQEHYPQPISTMSGHIGDVLGEVDPDPKETEMIEQEKRRQLEREEQLRRQQQKRDEAAKKN